MKKKTLLLSMAFVMLWQVVAAQTTTTVKSLTVILNYKDNLYGIPEDDVPSDDLSLPDYHTYDINDYGELVPDARLGHETRRTLPRIVQPKQHDFNRL